MTYVHMSFNALDIVSMLLSLLLAKIRILSCFFFLYLIVFNNLFIIPVAKENTVINTALVIPTAATATVA